MGEWVVEKVEESEAVRTSYCKGGFGWVGGWVGGWGLPDGVGVDSDVGRRNFKRDVYLPIPCFVRSGFDL